MSFNFMGRGTICSDFGAQKIKSATVSIVSLSICHEVMGLDAMILVLRSGAAFFHPPEGSVLLCLMPPLWDLPFQILVFHLLK